MMTPYEKFKSLPHAEQYLKLDITLLEPDLRANAMSDNEAARRLNESRKALFKPF